ncbi:E3 ubiquitin/ISG15 ligase TRIM25-like [Pygocentrus nattereri]|nr:E3 ubiquitin/ISG15 ligase TRIM25-like [Pygocentrus nattereri]
MAEANIPVKEQQLCCSICLDLLTDPVTVPCGHSYCMMCIREHWDYGGDNEGCFCPQCWRRFAVRPELNRNTVLAELVEKFRETSQTSQQRSPAVCGSGSAGVLCDVCSSDKQAAVSSCLVCLVSYCADHVQPHYESPAFKKHRLVPACRKLQERICPAHDRLYEFYCRTEQTCVCYLCTIGEHKGHDTVPAETARDEKVEVIMNWNRKINQRIQQEEKVCQDLRKAIKTIKCSAQLARDEIERMFTEMLASIERMHSDVMEQLKTQEENEVRGAEGILEQVEMEIVDLRTRSAEQEETSQTCDPFEFLQNFLSLTCPSWTETLASPPPNPKVTFERVVHSVSKLQKSLEDICTTEMSNIFETIEEVQIFQRGKPRQTTPKPQAPLNPIPEPTTREDFLHYSCYLTLASSIVHPNLSVHSSKRAVKCASNNSLVNKWPQALCREGLTGRCYWEVEYSDSGICTIGLCEGVQRRKQSLAVGFGRDALSWGLDCFHLTYVFRHDNENITIPAPKSTTRVGVYLDHRAGTLSFYSVSSTMTLLHRVRSNFTQPLYPGFALWTNGWQNSTPSYFFKDHSLTSDPGHMSIKIINL